MKAEILAIGTEIIMGDTINSNAAWLSQQLATLGIDVYHHSAVGDNLERIHAQLQISLSRADILLTTGGLGPTDDDMTHETLASFFKRSMERDQALAEEIKNRFFKRGIDMPDKNLKQADRPQGSTALLNPSGTAPGIIWCIEYDRKPKVIITFPGVPREMKAMWPQAAAFLHSTLQEAGQVPQVLVTKNLRFAGIGESVLVQHLQKTDPELMTLSNPTVAPYVGNSEIRLRIAAKANTHAEAMALIEPVQQRVVVHSSPYYFGEDKDTLESVIGEWLTTKKMTLAVAESCTGGLVSSRLTDIPGSSQYITLNMVTYSNQQKTGQLGVSEETLAQYGAVSEQAAREMAEGICRVAKSDMGVSVTGIAGPDGGSEEKPVGLVFIGIAGPGNETVVKKVITNSTLQRTDIKYVFSQYALFYTLLALRGQLALT